MMKEAKKTPVPLPGSKTKAKAQSTPLKGSLSNELVGSDDDSSTENATMSKTAEKPKMTIAVHRPNGAVKSKTKSTKEPKAAPKKPTPKKVATQAQAAELSSSDQTDDEDATTRDIQTKLPGDARKSGSAGKSGSDSDSDSSSGSSSDESDADGALKSAQKSTQARAQPSQTQPHAVEFRPTQAYVPPKGFNTVPWNNKTMSKSARTFESLEGKQIWHITAPAGMLLNEVKEIDMDRALNGEAILQHKGTGYGFSRAEQSHDGACEVMVPNQNGYKAVGTRIAQSLHLQAVVQLPQLSSKQADQNTGSEAAASITRSTIRAPRPQLKGLKMRFLPTGFGGGNAGTLGDSDSEEDTPQVTAGLGMPNGLNLPSRKVKRKHTELNGDARSESPSKKHKKHRTPEDVQRKEERRAKKEKRRAQEAALAKS